MARDPERVVQYLGELEEVAEDVLTDKHQIVDLDRRRNKNREAIRALEKQNGGIHDKSWVCIGNMFLKMPTSQTTNLLKEDQKKLDAECENLRLRLRKNVNKLRDLEGKPELQGFDLQPLTQEEAKSVNQVMKTSGIHV